MPDSWPLSADDIEALEVGAAILGTGGGGNPYIGKLRAREAMAQGYELKVQSLDSLDDDAQVVSLGGIGAPVISIERLREGHEGLRALRALEDRLGCRVDAIACEEIGGANSMEPLITASFAGLAVVNCDGMGRAFPEMQMSTYSIYGHKSTPGAMSDIHGNIVILENAISARWFERLARASTIGMGGAAVQASAPMRGSFVKRHAVPNSYTQAISLGRAVLEARANHDDPIQTVCRLERGRHVFTGKVTDLKRHLKGGFAIGNVSIEGVDDCAGQCAEIAIQNEFLVFRRNGVVEVAVPDLIVVLDAVTGDAITTEILRFGQRVAVLALPCHPLLQTPQALEVIGPAAFGFPEIAYHPLAGSA